MRARGGSQPRRRVRRRRLLERRDRPDRGEFWRADTEECGNVGKSKSIARAIEELVALGRHDFVSVLDADTLVDTDYFRTVVRTFRADGDVVLVCGQPRSRRHNWLTAYRAVEYAVSHVVYKQAQQRMSAITIRARLCVDVPDHGSRTSGVESCNSDGGRRYHGAGLPKAPWTVVYEKRAMVHTQDPGTVSARQGQLRRWYTGYWQVVMCHRIPLADNGSMRSSRCSRARLSSSRCSDSGCRSGCRFAQLAWSYLLMDQILCLRWRAAWL